MASQTRPGSGGGLGGFRQSLLASPLSSYDTISPTLTDKVCASASNSQLGLAYSACLLDIHVSREVLVRVLSHVLVSR